MTRARLHQLLTSALVLALPACGGSVFDIAPAESDGGTSDSGGPHDANVDAAADAKADVAVDAKVDGEVDTGVCTPLTDGTPCNEKVTYPCGLPIALAGETPTAAECETLCAPVEIPGGPPFYCYVYADGTTGAKTVSCTSCAVGRRPHDLLDEPCEGGRADEAPVARALAEMARVEAASVHAFRRLERSLAGLGADERTLSRVRRAARDEIAHARRVSSLARARGGRHRPVRIDCARRASTYELALENAVEGCVRETLGVAYLAHQRANAADPELRALADALYEDELDHAALSWDLVSFFDAHLDEAERASLREAQRRALDEVVDEMGRIDPRVAKALGYPSQAVVARMVDALRGELFA